MIPAHVTRTLLLSLTAFFLVLQFQNCAPSHPTTRAEASWEDPDADSPVHAINQPLVGALAFEKTNLSVATQASTVPIRAACSSVIDQVVLEWKLLDPKGGPEIVRGWAECKNGELNIDLAPAQMLACNTTYHLSVATSQQSSQSLTLVRHCP